jgi:hypothetical protein
MGKLTETRYSGAPSISATPEFDAFNRQANKSQTNKVDIVSVFNRLPESLQPSHARAKSENHSGSD